MTTAAFDTPRTGTLTAAVAKRLRGVCAEENITGLSLAAATGMGRAMISRRLHGETALNTDELELIERGTGIRAEYLLTGNGEKMVRHQGLEPRTR